MFSNLLILDTHKPVLSSCNTYQALRILLVSWTFCPQSLIVIGFVLNLIDGPESLKLIKPSIESHYNNRVTLRAGTILAKRIGVVMETAVVAPQWESRSRIQRGKHYKKICQKKIFFFTSLFFPRLDRSGLLRRKVESQKKNLRVINTSIPLYSVPFRKQEITETRH